MFVCQWQLDIVYGKPREAAAPMRAWGAERQSSSEFRCAKRTRLLAGYIGASPSHIIDAALGSPAGDRMSCPLDPPPIANPPTIGYSSN